MRNDGLYVSFIPETANVWPSLVPRRGGAGGERAPSTHCLRMRLIAMEFRGDCVHTYTCDIINSLHWCTSWCSVEWVLYCAVLCLLVAGYLEIMLKKKQVASNECVYWGNVFMRLSTNFGKPIPTMAYQTFLFVPDSIKLGRACSSDVYIAS